MHFTLIIVRSPLNLAKDLVTVSLTYISYCVAVVSICVLDLLHYHCCPHIDYHCHQFSCYC